ncbi:hypothetical protein N9W17_02440 [Jannaschia sp.]|nr:hypothetical protein [Jannaschia sp.]
MHTPPALSAIVLTHDDYDVCRRIIGQLAQQTARAQIELILVGPSAERIGADQDDLARFGSHKIVEVGDVDATGTAMAAGVRAATAPVTCYVEEHDYIDDDYVERVIAAMARFDAPMVGFAIRPINPGIVSWAHVFLQFGAVAAPVETGEARELGGHHVAYRRDFLLGYGDDLRRVMDNEGILFEDLRRAGQPMNIAGDIVVEHVQISHLPSLVRTEFIGQRIYASGRADVQRWSLAKRALYVVGSPAIPPLRVGRAIREVIRSGRSRELLPWILPAMGLAACAGAIGEALGYMFGSPQSGHRARTEIELDRYSFVTDSDRQSAPGKE